MTRRAAAAQATRQRIVQAAFDVHDEQGIASANLHDIAKRAGVSIGTLYRHFPRYEELVRACGELTFREVPPPGAEEAATALSGVADRSKRLRILVDAIFGFYERTGPMIEVMRRDRAALAPVAEGLHVVEAGMSAWIDEALSTIPDLDRSVVSALLDHRTWTALTEHGVGDPRSCVLELLSRG